MHTGGIPYGGAWCERFEVERIAGRFTNKALAVQVYRKENGGYELNCYIN
jgi:hypothetical protein